MRRLLDNKMTLGVLAVVAVAVRQFQQGYSFRYDHKVATISRHRHNGSLCQQCGTGKGTSLRGRRRAYATMMAVDPSIGCESRVRGDPEALERWVFRVGGRIDSITIEGTPEKGWGLRADRNFDEGETIAVIPSRWCITLSPHDHSNNDHNSHVSSRVLVPSSRGTTLSNVDGGGGDNGDYAEKTTTQGQSAPSSTTTENNQPESAFRQNPYWTLPPPLASVIDQVPPQYEDVRLGLVLLHERYKMEDSEWEPYIQNLPEKVRGVPLASFDNSQRVALQDDALAKVIDNRAAFLIKFVKEVLDPLPTGPGSLFGEEAITYGKLAWAASVVSSRGFRFDARLLLDSGATASGDPVLIPFLDMVNFNFDVERVNVQVRAVGSYDELHGYGRQGKRKEGAEEVATSLRLITTRSVATGESLEMRPLFDKCYVDDLGKLDNRHLLVDYGFVNVDSLQERASLLFHKNVLHYARLLVRIMTEPFGSRVGEHEIEPWQHKVLVEADLDGPHVQIVVHLGGDRSDGKLPVDPRLLAALRTMFARNRDELQGKGALELADYKKGRLSDYVERRVLATLNGLMNMFKWKSTLAEDEILLYGREVTPDLLDAEESSPPAWLEADEGTVYRQDFEPTAESQTDSESESRLDANPEAIVATDFDRTTESETGSDSTAGSAGAPTNDGANNDDERQEGEEQEEQSLEINPALSWEVVQAVKYRLAIKRSMRDVAMILRAEIAKIGLVKGMRLNPNLAPRLQAIADKATPLEERDVTG